MDLKVVWDVCVAVVAAQRRSERYVVPSTLLCRWNVTLPRFDGEDQGGESYLALLEELCFVIAGGKFAITFTCFLTTTKIISIDALP